MTDLRQGVTPTQHAVLDLIEERAAEWSAQFSFQKKLELGRNTARGAASSKRLEAQLRYAITAAALLIDAADEISRLIAAPGEPS